MIVALKLGNKKILFFGPISYISCHPVTVRYFQTNVFYIRLHASNKTSEHFKMICNTKGWVVVKKIHLTFPLSFNIKMNKLQNNITVYDCGMYVILTNSKYIDLTYKIIFYVYK